MCLLQPHPYTRHLIQPHALLPQHAGGTSAQRVLSIALQFMIVWRSPPPIVLFVPEHHTAKPASLGHRHGKTQCEGELE